MPPEEFILLGDALWLDFVNSAGGRTPSPPDLFPDVAAFVRWSELQHLNGTSETPAFAQVRQLRTRLTELAEALHDGRQPPAGSIAALNELLGQSAGSQQLTRVGGEWRLRFAPSRPTGALEAIARSAAATLGESRIAVRRCAGETCSLFFTDDSTNGSRRWCDDSVCGQFTRVERRRGLRR
jgi:predicted RNA-binding Zn ribbon-like protein